MPYTTVKGEVAGGLSRKPGNLPDNGTCFDGVRPDKDGYEKY